MNLPVIKCRHCRRLLRITLGVKDFSAAGIKCFAVGAGCRYCGGWTVRSMPLDRYAAVSNTPGFPEYLESVIEAAIRSPVKGMWI